MATYPVIEVGDIITADLLTSMQPNYIVKSANQSIISSTTFQTDTELVTPSLAVGMWEVYFNLIFTSACAIKLQWTNTGTMANNRRANGPGSSATTAEDNATGRYSLSGFGTPVVYGFRSGTNQYRVEELATVNVTGAGAITLQWGQNVSTATNTTCVATSYVRTKQIS